MLYETVEDLPQNIKNILPLYAQEVYRQVFNKTWEEYGDPHINMSDVPREGIAHKLALEAAKQAYNENNSID